MISGVAHIFLTSSNGTNILEPFVNTTNEKYAEKHGDKYGELTMVGVEAEDDDVIGIGRKLSTKYFSFDSSNWLLSREVEGVLRNASKTSNLCEVSSSAGKVPITPDQADILIRKLYNFYKNHDDVYVPESRNEAPARARMLRKTQYDSLTKGAKTIVRVMAEELEKRIIHKKIPKFRLIGLAMSKQCSSDEMRELFSTEQLQQADKLYKEALLHVYEQELGGFRCKQQQQAQQGEGEGLVQQRRKSALNLFKFSGGQQSANSSQSAAQLAVEPEIRIFRSLTESVLSKFRDEDGIINHYALFTEQKSLLPLHYAVFRQTAPGITNEATCERVFSAAKGLSDPNMSSDTLSNYVYIRCNH